MPPSLKSKLMRTGKVQGGTDGGRWFLISHATDDTGPVRCSTLLERKLSALGKDKLQRPIKAVKRRPVDTRQLAQEAAGNDLVPGGDRDWTDFIAVITSSYALINRGDPGRRELEPTVPVGEFALAIDLLRRAAEPAPSDEAAAKAPAQQLWAAVVEQSDWRDYMVAGRSLGEVQVLKVLLNDRTKQPFPRLQPGEILTRLQLDERIKLEVLATTPPKTLDAHLSAAVTQLMYAGLPPSGPAS